MILAGDVGGTSTRLALFRADAAKWEPRELEVFPSRNFSSLSEVVRAFVEKHGEEIESACFGVAGPVKEGRRAEATNLPWDVDAERLAAVLDDAPVQLINDLEANAYGIAALSPEDLAELNPGAPDAAGNQALISAGTGLGEAALIWDGTRHVPTASEGGHADFAPRNDLQIELLRFLMKEFGRVSYERVVSGPGLLNVYRFLRGSGRGSELSRLRDELAAAPDPSAVISQNAIKGSCELCVHALELFVSIYGAEAGNLALKVLSRGGVFLGGGIAPKILAQLKRPAFMEAFRDKGRLKPVLEAMPVQVILNDKTALLGAARRALLCFAVG